MAARDKRIGSTRVQLFEHRQSDDLASAGLQPILAAGRLNDAHLPLPLLPLLLRQAPEHDDVLVYLVERLVGAHGVQRVVVRASEVVPDGRPYLGQRGFRRRGDLGESDGLRRVDPKLQAVVRFYPRFSEHEEKDELVRITVWR